MKTKLLRKIRKRYSIVYYPNGNQSWIREGYKEPCVILYDNDSIVPEMKVEFIGRLDGWSQSKEEAYTKCHKRLVELILSDYVHLGKRRNSIRNKIEKLWYNEK